jgi:hypothetical protein
MNEMNRFLIAAQAMSAAPSADNSQPCRIEQVGDEIFVSYRPHEGRDPFGVAGHGTLISVGAVAENLTQISGLSTVEWRRKMDGAPYFSARIPASPLPGGLDHPLFVRHTNRFPFTTPAPEADLIDTLGAMTQGPARLHLAVGSPSFGPLTSAARVCCHARFCTRDLHEWLMGSLRFGDEEVARGDGLDIRTVNLPPGGGLFMRFIRDWSRMALLNKMHIYRIMAQAEIQSLTNASMIVSVVGSGAVHDVPEAGRLMQRAWIELNRRGWAVHPHYVITDQKTRLQDGRLASSPWGLGVREAVDGLSAHLGLGAGERLHIMLRVGKPTRTPVRSLRLPLSRVFGAC